MRVTVEVRKSSGEVVPIFDEKVVSHVQAGKLRTIMDMAFALEKEIDEYVGAMESDRC